MNVKEKKIAQESKRAIAGLHVAMLHLFGRGYYKPMGLSGTSLREQLLILQPEIYGSIANSKKVELQGLLYVLERLPKGIENCTYINLTAAEGLDTSGIEKIVPSKRRRNCYKIDNDQMNIEITRGKSDIYDVLTHLTFMYLESHKLLNRIFVGNHNHVSHEWEKFEELIVNSKENEKDKPVLFAYLSTLLNRSFDEVKTIYTKLSTDKEPNRFFSIIYGLGTLAIREKRDQKYRLIRFSDALKEQIGKHTYGSIWAKNAKNILESHGLLERPLHVISANMHSVLNVLYAKEALAESTLSKGYDLYKLLSLTENKKLRNKVTDFALENGLIEVKDTSGANIDVQIIDVSKIFKDKKEVILVMDYAFGEQAFETMDELLKPYGKYKMNVQSISIMGKAGILSGEKGDLMIPQSHIAEGTADNYTFENQLSLDDFKNQDLFAYTGNMLTVLGTSLQNKYILNYFKSNNWNAIGLEMEGVHYQKAIQIASKIRGYITKDVKLRYAYYASDNPLHSGSTLASGGLGTKGVKPTYAITEVIVNQILEQ